MKENKIEEEKVNEKIAKEVVIGDYVMIKSQPCVVIETAHSKPGKHLMKALIKGENLITRRKIQDIVKLQGLVEVIFPEFYEFEVIDVDKDEMVSLLDKKMELREITLQDDDELKKNFLEQFRLSQEKEINFYAKLVKVNEQ